MKIRKELIKRTVLKDWISLNDYIMDLNEEEILYAMKVENERERVRRTFLTRLGQRYGAIKAAEIRAEMKIGVPEDAQAAISNRR